MVVFWVLRCNFSSFLIVNNCLLKPIIGEESVTLIEVNSGVASLVQLQCHFKVIKSQCQLLVVEIGESPVIVVDSLTFLAISLDGFGEFNSCTVHLILFKVSQAQVVVD